MPVGDNQHSFTCVACNVRKSTTERCPASSYCSTCCRANRGCVRTCSGCRAVFAVCGSAGAGVDAACLLCQRHDCIPITTGSRAYSCKCRVCPSCGTKRKATGFYSHRETACIECHPTACLRAGCVHCRTCGSPMLGEAETECCGTCEACCSANSCSGNTPVEWSSLPMRVDPVFTQAPIKRLARKTQFGFNPIKRTIGYEIECSEFKNGKAITKAVKDIGGAIVSDGSVARGFEINTPPMNGDVLTHSLAYLSQVLVASRARASAKAGLHVHVDCTDMEYDDMRRMVMLYGRLESGLFSIIDPRRLTENYSKPNGGRSLLAALADPTSARKDLIKMVYTRPPVKGWESWTKGKSCDGDRYWAMNIHSWFLRGTVEFRLHHGTVQWEKMMGFGMLLGAIADGALSIPEREIVDFPQGRDGLLRIAPTEWCRSWVKQRWDHFAAKRKNKDEPIADF